MTIPISSIKSFSNAYNSRALFLIDRFPELRLWISTFELPGINIPINHIDYIEHGIKTEGATITYAPLTISLYLDEFFVVYKSIYNWLHGMIPGENYVSSKTDTSILVLDNSYTKIIAQFDFTGMTIDGMSALSYDNFGSTHQTITLNLPFDNFTPTFKMA